MQMPNFAVAKNSDEMHYIYLCEGKVLLAKNGNEYSLPESTCEELTQLERGEVFESGEEGTCYRICALSELTQPKGTEWVGLRESAVLISREAYMICAKGSELLHWDSATIYCGRCGARMRRNSPISKLCEGCGTEIVPQLSPAVLVLVKRGDEALLVHARNFKRPFFGLVAGFVETGESLEECVAREVMEETTLSIGNIRYFGSQSWPFPSSLMIGFTAEYRSGEIRFADGELSQGGFFSRSNLPELPSPPSLARVMIDAWVSGEI